MKTFDEAVELLHRDFETNPNWWPNFVEKYGKGINEQCKDNDRICNQIYSASLRLALCVQLGEINTQQLIELIGPALTTIFTVGVAIGIEMEKAETL